MNPAEREARDAARRAAQAFGDAGLRWRPSVGFHEEGRVRSAQDGVVRAVGLPGAASEEVVHIGPARVPALVLGLDGRGVQAAVLGDPAAVRVGDRVRASGRLSGLPVGQALLGRVIDPLGEPLDGRPLVGPMRWAPHEREAPPLQARAAVERPLYTGTLAIDAMFPLGRGQRELILGDEGSGRTSLALTAMLRQAGTEVICVYVGVGRRRAESWQIVHALREGGVRFVAVLSAEDEPPGRRTLAPFAGTAVAEHFRDRGEHVLIVYDDLSAHAVAWRELSLLLGRPPGREAYPGDVFYLHARLLERATQLSRDHGGGSLTALPIATTEDGRLSAYIPTNLIAITDGQVVLSRSLFAAGQLPAIDAGLSVSRVGGRAQTAAYRRLAGRLRLDYAAFLELEGFARVGTRLEGAAMRRLALGRRLRRLLRAPRGAAQGVPAQVARLALAGASEALLAVPEEQVEAFAAGLPALLQERAPDLLAGVEADEALGEGEHARLLRAVTEAVVARWPLPAAEAP